MFQGKAVYVKILRSVGRRILSHLVIKERILQHAPKESSII